MQPFGGRDTTLVVDPYRVELENLLQQTVHASLNKNESRNAFVVLEDWQYILLPALDLCLHETIDKTILNLSKKKS